MMGPNDGVRARSPYGQGLAGPPLGGPTGMTHPQSMLNPGFDPTYMNQAGHYRGFVMPTFPEMMHSFKAVNPVGLHGVAPHINPVFFGHVMSTNGMGLIGSSGMEGHTAGMWMDTSMGGWAGDEHGRGIRKSSYGA